MSCGVEGQRMSPSNVVAAPSCVHSMLQYFMRISFPPVHVYVYAPTARLAGFVFVGGIVLRFRCSLRRSPIKHPFIIMNQATLDRLAVCRHLLEGVQLLHATDLFNELRRHIRRE